MVLMEGMRVDEWCSLSRTTFSVTGAGAIGEALRADPPLKKLVCVPAVPACRDVASHAMVTGVAWDAR